LICAVTLGFIAAVEPAEDGIMDVPPRRTGKRLLGRFLILRIAIASFMLIITTVGSVFWVQDIFKKEGREYEDYLPLMRSQASNTLTFGACFVTVSSRFSYQSAFSMRTLYGNKYAWYAVFLTGILQVFITYTPVISDTIFEMGPMEGFQWGICLAFNMLVFIVCEFEKAVRRYLKERNADTDDTEYGFLDTPPTPDQDITLPKGASHLKLVKLQH
jgi:magnesium-transporting ATPase (P-type)